MGFIGEFKEFAVKGNVIDMAVGIIIGAAFGSIVNSLVKDIIMPPVGMLMGGINFADMFVALDGKTYATSGRSPGSSCTNYQLRSVYKCHYKFPHSGVGCIHVDSSGECLEEAACTT